MEVEAAAHPPGRPVDDEQHDRHLQKLRPPDTEPRNEPKRPDDAEDEPGAEHDEEVDGPACDHSGCRVAASRSRARRARAAHSPSPAVDSVGTVEAARRRSINPRRPATVVQILEETQAEGDRKMGTGTFL
jgi:hypothetical protein